MLFRSRPDWVRNRTTQHALRFVSGIDESKWRARRCSGRRPGWAVGRRPYSMTGVADGQSTPTRRPGGPTIVRRENIRATPLLASLAASRASVLGGGAGGSRPGSYGRRHSRRPRASDGAQQIMDNATSNDPLSRGARKTAGCGQTRRERDLTGVHDPREPR